jgi:hypothetical protein
MFSILPHIRMLAKVQKQNDPDLIPTVLSETADRLVIMWHRYYEKVTACYDTTKYINEMNHTTRNENSLGGDMN